MKKQKTLEEVFDMPAKEKEEKKEEEEAPKKAPTKRVKKLDLEKEKELCEQKLQIIEKLKEARLKRGAAKAAPAAEAPKEAAAAPPTPKEAEAVAPVAALMPPPPSAPIPVPLPKKITYCTFKKPIWS